MATYNLTFAEKHATMPVLNMLNRQRTRHACLLYRLADESRKYTEYRPTKLSSFSESAACSIKRKILLKGLTMENLLQPVTVTVSKGRATTTSQNIALVFGKPHKVVLNAIRQIIADLPDENNRHNFMPTYYRDTHGRHQPSYRLTRDGFTLLAMGFTGKTALQFKLAYIDAFNKMEMELAARREPKYIPVPAPKMTEMELFLRVQNIFTSENNLDVARNKRDLLTNAIAHIINQKEFSQNIDRYIQSNQRGHK